MSDHRTPEPRPGQPKRHDSRTVLFRPAPPPDATVAYGEHPDQVLDLHRPAGEPRGVVVFLHGGFWRDEYDRVHTRPLATALAADGYLVVTPEFRRTGAPDSAWPHTLDDVEAAVRAVPRVVGQPLESLVLAGHSAGGHLALWAASVLMTTRAAVRGVVALAPVSSLAWAYNLDLDDGAVAALMGGGPADVPQRYADADPMARLPLGVPLVICHGDRDAQVPIVMSRAYADAAKRAGDQVKLFDWPAVDHFDVIDPESPAWPDVVEAFRRFDQH